MKSTLFWTLRRHGYRFDYEVMGVTSIKSSYRDDRFYGRDRFDMPTNAAGRQTVGRFTTKEEAQQASILVEVVAKRFTKQIEHVERQAASLRHERGEAMDAEARALSTYVEPEQAKAA